MTDLTDLCEAIVCGDSRRAEESARCALAAGTDPAQLFTAGVIPAMQEARRRFQTQEYYVPEMLIACNRSQPP
jgi:methanogenic corrinoid protein MtbC1